MAELNTEAERLFSPLRAHLFHEKRLLKATESSSINELWHYLAGRPYPAARLPLEPGSFTGGCPGSAERIQGAADDALAHKVNLLGSGPIQLGAQIDWHKDYKSGFSWPPAYIRSIDYNNPERPSDVKFPWELSRMQWLIPAGQAYLLTGDERYAAAARDILDDWIDANPCAHSVNWACTMEVALRILSWTWFFHAFGKSAAWSGNDFRFRFLRTLYLHGDFTARHLERSDINGNHYTADAAGLVFAGLFFGRGKNPERWQKLGWEILCDELPRQVFPDGVDFEASVPYHRLVLELFFLPALFRERCSLEIPGFYRERVIAMARFTAAYSRNDGSVPLWGDADDARALPFGGQPINDHRYLLGLVGAAWDVPELKGCYSGPADEIFWLLGPEAAASLPASPRPSSCPASTAFPNGGFYVMRNERDHILIDCGPLGLAGRGGHGHNDALSFEAVLDGVPLVSDCGAYLYTASYEERNNFRSTAYHNTPRVDGEEINRFIRPDYLWNLHDDAKPEVRRWSTSGEHDIFVGSHSGYRRLSSPLTPVRTLTLDHARHSLVILDEFEGEGEHLFEIPLHLAPGVEAELICEGRLRLRSGERTFRLEWGETQEWELRTGTGRVSPSYGISRPVTRLCWQRRGIPDTPLAVSIVPEGRLPAGS